jgi:hypothetical protein
MIDYAYTISGDNPVMSGKFDEVIDLEPGDFVKRLRVRLLWPQKRKLSIQPHNTDIQPKITAGEEMEYQWERRDVAPIEGEDRVPGWYFSGAWVEVGEFENWSDVVAWGLPMYRPDGAMSPELQSRVDAIARDSASAEARLLAALRFVQDEIRYLGIEMGQYSHQPTLPAKVLARRFGDCKDKALLLTTMLQALGIDAAPALVNSRSGKAVDSRQPSPYVFDHVIVNVRLAGQTYWRDGTRTFQRGGLKQFYNPTFAKALVLRPGVAALEDITSPALASPTIFATERYVVSSLTAPVALTVTTVYTGEDADEMRYFVSRTSPENLGKQYLNFYAEDSPQIEASGLPQIADDESTNTLTVTERYSIPDFWKNDVHQVNANRIVEEVGKPRVSKRSMPLRVRYPLNIRQRIEIEMPEPADAETDSRSFRDSAIAFEYSSEWSGKLLVLEYSLQTMQDHVPVKDVPGHLVTLSNIFDILGYDVPMHPSHERTDARNSAIALVSAAAIGVVGFAVVKIARRRRKTIRRRQFVPRRGEGAASAIEVADTDAMRKHAELQSCYCGKRFDLDVDSVNEEHLAYDGNRITVLRMNCGACKSDRDVYFRVGVVRVL